VFFFRSTMQLTFCGFIPPTGGTEFLRVSFPSQIRRELDFSYLFQSRFPPSSAASSLSFLKFHLLKVDLTIPPYFRFCSRSYPPPTSNTYSVRPLRAQKFLDLPLPPKCDDTLNLTSDAVRLKPSSPQLLT